MTQDEQLWHGLESAKLGLDYFVMGCRICRHENCIVVLAGDLQITCCPAWSRTTGYEVALLREILEVYDECWAGVRRYQIVPVGGVDPCG